MTSLAPVVNPLIWRELAAIGAIDAAVPRQTDAGYTFLYLETKLEKQANVTQLTTLLRRQGEQPDMATGLMGAALKAQTAVTQAVDTTATLRAMRLVGRELIQQYVTALEQCAGLAAAALTTALRRTVVQDSVLSAHIARRSGDATALRDVPRPLAEYFASDEARVCMRCLLDRPGRLRPLERRAPRPDQYICAACHDEVRRDVPSDLQESLTRAADDVHADHLIHRALSRASRLTAVHTVLYPLSGLHADPPSPAAAKAVVVPEAVVSPGPMPATPRAVTTIDDTAVSTDERVYVDILLDPAQLGRYW